MTSHEFWLSVVLIGGIIKPAVGWVIKMLWAKFVHSSQHTIDIWWSHKKKQAERTIEEAMRIIGGSAP